jgi:hypothetical protein
MFVAGLRSMCCLSTVDTQGWEGEHILLTTIGYLDGGLDGRPWEEDLLHICL